MAEIKNSVLFGKLTKHAYEALQSAVVLCRRRGNPNVELLHLLHESVRETGKGGENDIQKIAQEFQIDLARLEEDIIEALDRLPSGSTMCGTSPHLQQAVERGWVYGSLLFGDSQVRSGYLVVGALKTPGLREILLSYSRELSKISIDRLSGEFSRIVNGSTEWTASAEIKGEAENNSATTTERRGRQSLDRFCVDLTENARRGKIDVIVGREFEVRQIVDILMRRRQNNPILTGEAGVGKTAVVEGFAARVAAGDVPPVLKNCSILSLDLGVLQAGASMKGEFEQRLKGIIDEVQASPTPIILFIDEAHTLIGAGGASGTGDAANLLKPALARGTLRTIAATTWSEYKKYFENDPALTRRFQVVKVEEPSEKVATEMLRKTASNLESHHRVLVLDKALTAAVSLSHRYISGRQLPDKAVSLLDTACARVGVSINAVPSELEDIERRIAGTETELRILRRENVLGIDHTKRLLELEETLSIDNQARAALKNRWNIEKELVEKIFATRKSIWDLGEDIRTKESDESPGGVPLALKPDELREQLRTLETQLLLVQGESPLVLPSVDEQTVASVISDWTGIPVGRMLKDEVGTVINLADILEKRIIGQRHALEAIAQRIKIARARLDTPGKPVGVFLLAGTSGVGKTESALALAEALYGGESNVITINMSEFQEAHTVSTLKGAPPGYVGYGEGGMLTEAVRRRPYSVVLLDEIEKAHPDVHKLFFQVFDKGWMEDGEGRFIDFSNTIIILTTNVGSELTMSTWRQTGKLPNDDDMAQEMRKTFPPALLGRLEIINYYPLSTAVLNRIIRLQLKRIEARLLENHTVELAFDECIISLIADRCTETESGGRLVDSILSKTILSEVSGELLRRQLDGTTIRRVSIAVKNSDFTYRYE